MTDAPKRIWLDWPAANKGDPVYDEPPERDTQPGQTEYIRADVARAEAEAMVRADDGWRDIATAPKDGTRILAYYDADDCIYDVVWDLHGHGDGWVSTDYNITNFNQPDFTHWRPLPALPIRARSEGGAVPVLPCAVHPHGKCFCSDADEAYFAIASVKGKTE